VNGNTYYIPYKYKQDIVVSGSGEYDMVLRLAEQYLIRAEARARQDKISGAISDLNAIRNRAGLTNTPAIDKESLLLDIEHERQTELFVEWGHRWLDLKRTGRIDEILGLEKTGWKSSAALFPIPQIELSKNSKLKQNVGY
jgi:hypothetical protein